ncbi:MAG: hypothetical protein SFU83_04245 [Meiothermus sp.]|nr:hypothetical protein [Meiothermus sp.]
MRVLFIEGKQAEPLQDLARSIPNPYRLMCRPEQGLYLLEVWAHAPELEARVGGMEGFKCWAFDVLQTNT